MNIGFFDSGVGGKTVAEAVKVLLPDYDTVYFGDTANAPYGNRAHAEIGELLEAGVRKLFTADSALVIVACNTASAQALRVVQNRLMSEFPDRRVLGVIIPTVEEFVRRGYKHVLIFSTVATASSGAYEREFSKLDPSVSVTMNACPNWATMIEAGLAGTEEMKKEIQREMDLAFSGSEHFDAVLLGCTHYPFVKDKIEQALPYPIPVFDQGPIVARALEKYLRRHPEVDGVLGRDKSAIILS